ncbi:MAG: hypothetical protein CL477_19115 [Acidobacteria bacterium]|jgi:hypothetical protein|nr:hypothetical protein [Acidobacteriota bacterium]MDP7339037.1 hypothetical protein [Vicinamibacterales bacterium]MDP7480423.1 hypothetical protein [Vicinamibacterales bacterium]MDP7691832.1 hypothetical protein [Vicinamibacterales bacterium]HJN46752.1 hypothetical protein [Vicinamibacterales bacterium]|tara:strand:- start:1810 stop:2808 length:999 start_codon:yes stop_codon:yes gene_type:complete
MRSRAPHRLAIFVVVALCLSPAAVSAQQNWTVPRTPAGQPDLQGVWANNTATPLERPAAFEGKDALTDEELAIYQARAAALRDSEQAGNLLGDLLIQQVLEDPNFREFDPGTGNYNSFWLVERELDNRTSLIVDPPDGRIPTVTEAARERRRNQPRPTGGRADSHERRSLLDRCISYGVPNLLAGYNAYFQIAQSADHVVIYQELIHDARVIPIDGTPHLNQSIRQLHGDSRGRWEGDTLVVETTNYSSRGSYRGATDNVRVVERFTRIAPETVTYEVTFEDPDTWAQPWTLMIPLKQSAEPIFEYACHEGNYAIAGILAGARAEEAAADPR